MAGQCMCGWVRDEQGRLFEQDTGWFAGYEKRGRRRIPAWMMELEGQPCFYCGNVATTKDHKIPKSRGGRNTRDNIVPACEPCNNLKGSRTVAEFIAYTESLMWAERERERELQKELREVLQFGWIQIPA